MSCERIKKTIPIIEWFESSSFTKLQRTYKDENWLKKFEVYYTFDVIYLDGTLITFCVEFTPAVKHKKEITNYIKFIVLKGYYYDRIVFPLKLFFHCDLTVRRIYVYKIITFYVTDGK